VSAKKDSLVALPNFFANNLLGMVLVFLSMWVAQVKQERD
jgi:hypothetical protein